MTMTHRHFDKIQIEAEEYFAEMMDRIMRNMMGSRLMEQDTEEEAEDGDQQSEQDDEQTSYS